MGMTLLDHGQPADTTTKKHRTGLIAVLAVLTVALLAAGAWLFVDRQQQQPLSAEEPLSSTEQQHAAIMEVVTAYNNALNAHDSDALRATITDDFTWNEDSPNEVITADVYADVVTAVGGYGGAGIREAFTGDPVFSGDFEVAIPTYQEAGREEARRGSIGTLTYTLREVDGQLKIASMVFEGQRLFTEQQVAIMAVVTANKDANNAHDSDALRATITDDFTYGEPPEPYEGPSADDWATDGHVTFTGGPAFSGGDLQVAIGTHLVTGGVWGDGTLSQIDGTFTYTLREVDGQLKIASMVFESP
jgi:ketosteroid isomerase-like protein